MQNIVPYHFPLSIAPMMDWTDRHYRYMMRQLTQRTLLYTEMVTTGALLHGDVARHLAFSDIEHPLALQLGGDDPAALAACAKLAQEWGYDEVNLNVGCPSARVQKGRFGACLMATPERVRDCVAAMQDEVTLPVTVKHRIGIDNLDRYEDLAHFVEVVQQARPAKFTVHARIAWLAGLSPKENRHIPPLRYDDVYRLKRAWPELYIEINGGITTWDDVPVPAAHTNTTSTNAATDVQQDSLHRHAANYSSHKHSSHKYQRGIFFHSQHVDAVMIGRAAYHNPYLFAYADTHLAQMQVSPQQEYQPQPVPSRRDVVLAMLPYVQNYLAQGGKLSDISRHMLQLFAHMPGAKAWKRHLSTHAHQAGADGSVLLDALAQVPQEAQQATLNAHYPPHCPDTFHTGCMSGCMPDGATTA